MVSSGRLGRVAWKQPCRPYGYFSLDALYLNLMAGRKINVGEVWKSDATGEAYLVTRLFNEALATFAVLRLTTNDKAKPLRVKVSHGAGGMALPGYTPTQDSERK
jgi:hypothetical protein